MNARQPKLWIDAKVLAKTKGRHAQDEEDRILINRYLELADIALKNDSRNNPKKAA